MIVSLVDHADSRLVRRLVRPCRLFVRRLFAAACAATWLLSAAGCAHNGQSPPPLPKNDVKGSKSGTQLGAGDVFTVQVYGEKELSGKFRVSASGTIEYPLVGTVRVAGMSPPDVAKILRKKLSEGFLRDPFVSVFVKEYQSKKISVFGQVKRPGTFPFVENMSIVEAITLAGGLTPIASKNKITVTRTEKGKKRRYTVPVEKIGEGRAANYLLRPGDVVFVPERLF